jgi:hypothetical protein
MTAKTAVPTVRHNYTPDKFPLTLSLYSGKTGELLWSRTVTFEEAAFLARIDVPGYANTEHYPVRSEIRFASGEIAVGGLS